RGRHFPDPQAPETFADSTIEWHEIAQSPHRELLAFNRALLALRKESRCLSNCRNDLTTVRLSESERWIIIRRGDSSGEAALLFCNLSSKPLVVPVPRVAAGMVLAPFTSGEPFSGPPDAAGPP